MQAIYLLSLTTLHGLPYATTPFGMFFTTNDPAPMIVLLPTCTPSIIFVPIPIKEFSPMVTLPAILVPGFIEQ